jgi:hypothetical protein
VGDDVVLGRSWTGSGAADRLVLAHELTHVLQQRRAGVQGVQRQALDQPETASAPRLRLLPGDDLAASKAVMRAIDEITLMPDGRYVTTYLGEELFLTEEHAQTARATAHRAVVGVLDLAWKDLDEAVEREREARRNPPAEKS